jgi:16S rRNA (uracil1498-N3)-methyltransferase
MHRCYAAPAQWTADGGVRLSAGEARHVAQVLRLRAGDCVEVFDGHGRVARGHLAAFEAEAVTVRIEEAVRMPAAPLSIALVQALPKGRGMDLIVEKATEIGVHAIYPVLTDRCVAQPVNEKAQQRADRWRRISRSAAKQCGTNWLPDIRPIARLDDVLAPGAFDCLLAGALMPGLRMLHAVVTELQAAPPRRLGIVIGPEGDLSAAEIDRIVGLGGVPVCFGGNVLRVETAAIFALSILAYELLWPRS